ncbi:hypothetical protein [Limihaloglobus sulfuriphilus]|uniref:hypothetical protein n=1 Tax=Limihaloglobus sulfuriphilus TaxID=1851148 RepID=UPI0011BA735B|nr:hypothetical protein [Limihaloglobus sulfuriphilus]
MEHNKYLGIYISKKTAVGVLVSTLTGGPVIEDVISRDLEPGQTQEDSSSQSLEHLGALLEDISSRGYTNLPVSVCIDNSLYTQYIVVSRFSDNTRIARTIGFDVEEIIGQNVDHYALTYQTLAREQAGTRLGVYLTEKSLIRGIITSFQEQGLDPVAIEPDVVCLSRIISASKCNTSGSSSPLFAAITDDSCYIMAGYDACGGYGRSFLFSHRAKGSAVRLARELKLFISLKSLEIDPDKVFITEQIPPQKIENHLDIPVANIEKITDLPEKFEYSSTDFRLRAAVSAGAALVCSNRYQPVNFRRSYMPYQGRIKVFERFIQSAMIAAAVILIAFTILGTSKYLKLKSQHNQLTEKIKTEYKLAMNGRNPRGYPILEIDREIAKLEKIKSGDTAGDKTVSGMLIQIFNILSNTDKNNRIKVESISVTDKTIRLDGTTAGRRYTLELIEMLRKNDFFTVSQEDLKQEGADDKFVIRIDVSKQPASSVTLAGAGQ